MDKLFKLAIVATLLVFAGCVLTESNKTPVPKALKTNHSQNQNTTLTIETKSISHPPREGEAESTEKNFGVHIEYPQISGLGNRALEKKINEAIRRFVGIDDTGEYFRAKDVTYEQIYGEGDYLQFHFSFWAEGGAHPFSSEKSLVLNVNSGESYEIADLFQPFGIEILTGMIRERLADYYLMGENAFDEYNITGDTQFAFDKDTLFLYFSDCEVASCAAGPAKIGINLHKLKDIIKPNGPLSFSL